MFREHYAYFSDSETTNGIFATGTLKLSAKPTELIDIDNLKLDDSMTQGFELKNEGILDIKEVSLDTYYKITDTEGDNEKDLGNHNGVEFLYKVDYANEVIYETTLKELKDESPDTVKEEGLMS